MHIDETERDRRLFVLRESEIDLQIELADLAIEITDRERRIGEVLAALTTARLGIQRLLAGETTV
jgi:hypothetical protein